MYGVHSTRWLRGQGFTRVALAEAVNSGGLRRIRRGWYATVAAEPAVVAAVGAGGRVTCVSALKLAGVWTMPHPDVHVRVASGVTVRRAGMRLHWTHDRVRRPPFVDGVLEALEPAIQCLDLRAAVVAVDSILNRRLATADEVGSVLSLTPRGRRIRALIDPRAESGIETLARLALRRRNLDLRTQVTVPPVGRVDILIGDRLVLELDGRRWHDFEQDRARDRALTAQGYAVIRASYRQVLDEWPLIEEQISELVRRREHRWRSTLPQGARDGRGRGAEAR